MEGVGRGNEFFCKESKSKNKFFLFFFGGGRRGGRTVGGEQEARVSEFFLLSIHIFNDFFRGGGGWS